MNPTWLTILLQSVNAGLAAVTITGLVPAPIAGLITSLEPVVVGAIGSIQSGQGKVADVVTALGALSSVIAILKTQTNLDPKILDAIAVWDTAVQAGVAGFLDSKSGVDLSKLDPIAPIA